MQLFLCDFGFFQGGASAISVASYTRFFLLSTGGFCLSRFRTIHAYVRAHPWSRCWMYLDIYEQFRRPYICDDIQSAIRICPRQIACNLSHYMCLPLTEREHKVQGLGPPCSDSAVSKPDRGRQGIFRQGDTWKDGEGHGERRQYVLYRQVTCAVVDPP